MDIHHFHPIGLLRVHKNRNSCWTNALHVIYKLNVKTHTRVMNCVCFFNVHNIVGAKEQMTEILRMGTEAWFVPANFTEENILKSNDLALTFCESVDVPQTPVIWTSPRLTGICVCTCMGCKCVLSLHRSLCIIFIMGGKGDSCQVQREPCFINVNNLQHLFFFMIILYKLLETEDLYNNTLNAKQICNMN